MTVLSEIIPGSLHSIISPKLKKVNVTETKATCQNCLRARDNRFAYTYKTHLKCCTFHPYTPNYAVGAILLNSSESIGASRFRNKISKLEFTLPIGILPSFEYQFKFLNKEEEDFGNRDDLLCPYYNSVDNGCSIWEYRGCVCTSFFCRSDSGQKGQKFWAVLSDYLSYVEMALAEECLVQLDFSPRDLNDQLFYLNKREFDADEVEKKFLTSAEMKQLWNGYSNIEEFYIKCYRLVTQLDRKKFVEILGQQGVALEKEVLEYADFRKN